MLDGPGDADGDVELGRHHLAGLAHLQIVGHEACIHRGPRSSHSPAELVGQGFNQGKLRLGAERPPA
ncbi:hypothetical protein D3C78_1942160 [compost metagenome]